MLVYRHLFEPLISSTLGSAIAGSCGDSLFTSLRKQLTVWRVGVSHFTFSPARVPVSPFPYRHLFLVCLSGFCFIRAILSVQGQLFVVSFAFL